MATVVYDGTPLPGVIIWIPTGISPFNGYIRKVQQGDPEYDLPTDVLEAYDDVDLQDNIRVVTKVTPMRSEAVYLFTEQPLIGLAVPLYSRVSPVPRYRVISYD